MEVAESVDLSLRSTKGYHSPGGKNPDEPSIKVGHPHIKPHLTSVIIGLLQRIAPNFRFSVSGVSSSGNTYFLFPKFHTLDDIKVFWRTRQFAVPASEAYDGGDLIIARLVDREIWRKIHPLDSHFG